jgi:triosephosphate isomerase
MHKTAAEGKAFLAAFEPLVARAKSEIMIAAPFTALHALRSEKVWIGAQNMHDQEKGAFTGEISASMLKELGAQFVLLGHSERRTLFGESNAFIHRKLAQALQVGLRPILCVGETLQERESHQTQAVLEKQLKECIGTLATSTLLVAYEPVWAIGTGKAATADIADEAHATIKRTFKVPVLYGGSVTATNISELMKKPHIDGALVGGASLDPHTFAQLILNAQEGS